MIRRYSTALNSFGFIGLGQMGFPMCSNLIQNHKGPFWIYDANAESLKAFKIAHPNAQIASSPAQVASQCSVIVTMLPESRHVNAVYLGKNGILEGLNKPALLLDSSTIDPATSKEVSCKMASKNGVFLDTPVSGGTGGAKAGTLTFMVGSESQEIFDRAKPILARMGKNIVYCGSIGNGQVAKICNNMMLGISMIGACETMNLGVRLGMDPKLLASVINTSSGRCWSTDTYNPCPGVLPNVPSSKGYEGGFGVSLMAKDMGLAVTAANSVKSTTILAGTAHQIFNQVMTTPGLEKKDFSVVYQWLNDNSKRASH